MKLASCRSRDEWGPVLRLWTWQFALFSPLPRTGLVCQGKSVLPVCGWPAPCPTSCEGLRGGRLPGDCSLFLQIAVRRVHPSCVPPWSTLHAGRSVKNICRCELCTFLSV